MHHDAPIYYMYVKINLIYQLYIWDMIRSINAFDCMCVCKTSLVCLETYSSRLRVYDIRVCVCACVPLYTTNKFHKCICTQEIVASDYLTIYVKNLCHNQAWHSQCYFCFNSMSWCASQGIWFINRNHLMAINIHLLSKNLYLIWPYIDG